MPARGRCCKQHPRLERHQSLAMHITQSNRPFGQRPSATSTKYMALSRLEFGFKVFPLSSISYAECFLVWFIRSIKVSKF